jgi:hypothetical protein
MADSHTALPTGLEATPDTAPAGWAATLLDLLERQHAMVDDLAGLAARQSALVREGNTEALLGLLSARQRIIERFAAAQDRLNGLTSDIETRLDGVEEPLRTRIRTLIADIGDRLAQVMARDEADQDALGAAREAVRSELATLDASRQARAAYQPAATDTNRFADQRG